MTTEYYCAIFPFCGGGNKKKDDKKTKAFYDWATTGIPVKSYNVKYKTVSHVSLLIKKVRKNEGGVVLV